MTGTAVRARGTVRPARPFLSHLSGQDFVKLVENGWIPVDLVLGAAIGICHCDDLGMRLVSERTRGRRARKSWLARPREVGSWSDLVTHTRRAARRRLADEAAGTGAEGVLLSLADLNVSARTCDTIGGRDDVAETTQIGTAIVSFKRARHVANALPILRI